MKELLLAKLQQQVVQNLVYQLLIFLLAIEEKVVGDITQTKIKMNRGLTQGGKSSPALFRLFINDLPESLGEALQNAGLPFDELDPFD